MRNKTSIKVTSYSILPPGDLQGHGDPVHGGEERGRQREAFLPQHGPPVRPGGDQRPGLWLSRCPLSPDKSPAPVLPLLVAGGGGIRLGFPEWLAGLGPWIRLSR